jgi:Rps23 Pro-64 3,4-dihydroxylase Tpa1-like proline 4-hydroxylase
MKTIIINNFLSEEECESILNYSLTNLDLKQGKVEVDTKFELDSHRKSNIAFDRYLEFPYLIDRVHRVLMDNIDIKGCAPYIHKNKQFQFTQYKSGDYYDWHTDVLHNTTTNDRYCSIVIQLNNNYIGGNLELKDIIFDNMNTGTLYAFPSDMLHRVKKVKEGIRYSLVLWVGLIKKENYLKSLI